MDITGYNMPEPCYGIGVAKLVAMWIDLERAQIAAGMGAAARATKMMRRQLQEAAGLVGDPKAILDRWPDRSCEVAADRLHQWCPAGGGTFTCSECNAAGDIDIPTKRIRVMAA